MSASQHDDKQGGLHAGSQNGRANGDGSSNNAAGSSNYIGVSRRSSRLNMVNSASQTHGSMEHVTRAETRAEARAEAKGEIAAGSYSESRHESRVGVYPMYSTKFFVSRGDCAMVIAVVVVSVLAYVMGVSPARSHALQMDNSLEKLTSLDAQKRSLAEKLRDSRALRDELSTSIERAITLAPESSINARRATIASIAARSGITIKATRPVATQHGKRFDLVPIELSGQGDATQFATYVAALHEQLSDTAVRSFELSGPGTDGTARFSTTLVWYTLPKAEAVLHRDESGNEQNNTTQSER